MLLLRTFASLTNRIFSRLLPEGSVRIPLELLIRHCHELEDCDENRETKYGMIRSINAIFRHLKEHHVLMDLFFDLEQRTEQLNTENDGNACTSPHHTDRFWVGFFHYNPLIYLDNSFSFINLPAGIRHHEP